MVPHHDLNRIMVQAILLQRQKATLATLACDLPAQGFGFLQLVFNIEMCFVKAKKSGYSKAVSKNIELEIKQLCV